MLVTIRNPNIIVVVLEAVVQLELNLEHKSFSERNCRLLFYWSRIRNSETLLKRTGNCCLIGIVSRA
uniref:Uncharacterized protein n=1 Tax=Strongyloides stercoralis TaxID=6248 RepID=A0A0K0DS65_STRER